MASNHHLARNDSRVSDSISFLQDYLDASSRRSPPRRASASPPISAAPRSEGAGRSERRWGASVDAVPMARLAAPWRSWGGPLSSRSSSIGGGGGGASSSVSPLLSHRAHPYQSSAGGHHPNISSSSSGVVPRLRPVSLSNRFRAGSFHEDNYAAANLRPAPLRTSSVPTSTAPAVAATATTWRRSHSAGPTTTTATGRDVDAYEPVPASLSSRAPAAPLPPAAAAATPVSPPRRPAPQLPLREPRAASVAAAAAAEGFPVAGDHQRNLRAVAAYLKQYYAREVGESHRGLETLLPEDIVGLAQCFYVDLYRLVREARRQEGLVIRMFAAGDPDVGAVGGASPPTSGRREASTAATATYPVNDRGDSAAPAGGSGSPSLSSSFPSMLDALGEDEDEGVALHQQRGGAPGPSSRGRGASQPPPPPPPPRSTDLSVSLNGSAVLVSGPLREGVGGGGGWTPTHRHISNSSDYNPAGESGAPVQVVEAKVPDFYGSANTSTSANAAHNSSSSSPYHHQQPPSAAAHGLNHTHMSSTNAPSAAAHTHIYGMQDTTGLRTAFVPPDVQQRMLAGLPASPYGSRHRFRDMDESAAAPAPSHAAVDESTLAFLRGSPQRQQPPPSSSPLHTTPSPRAHGSKHPHRDPHEQQQQSQQQLLNGSRTPRSARAPRTPRSGQKRQLQFALSPAQHAGAASPPNARGGSPSHAQPHSGIVKRPLKLLMPLLRQGAGLVRFASDSREPRLRFFLVQDCLAVFQSREVLMPHLTWRSIPSDTSAAEMRVRASGSGRRGRGPPSFLTDVDPRNALNLIDLQGVYIGTATAPRLFRRRKGIVVDHRGEAMSDGMCAVLSFKTKAVGLGFLSEDERQVWIGALMGVVEKNRTLGV